VVDVNSSSGQSQYTVKDSRTALPVPWGLTTSVSLGAFILRLVQLILTLTLTPPEFVCTQVSLG